MVKPTHQLSFTPTTHSSFRTQYKIGRITAILGGFSPGMFEELYINFGLLWVIVAGILMGIPHAIWITRLK
jgi:hypothetical protein